jgi:hypothetical protein
MGAGHENRAGRGAIPGTAMERVDMLREQAQVMRGLARTIGVLSIRQQLFALADQCDHLAKEREEMLKRRPPREDG